MAGTSRSHTRLRASGDGDLLANRARGQMSPEKAARVLADLDKVTPAGQDLSVPSLIAALLATHPEASDADVARRVRGADEAMVAQVRGKLAAGRDPTAQTAGDDAGDDAGHPEDEEGEPTQEEHREPPVRASEVDLGLRYVVRSPSGVVVRTCATYETARHLRHRIGGSVQAVTEAQ